MSGCANVLAIACACVACLCDLDVVFVLSSNDTGCDGCTSDVVAVFVAACAKM